MTTAAMTTALRGLANAAWRPEHLSPSDWAERHLILSHRFTSYAGRFRLSWTPYAREIIDCIADPDVDEVTVMSAAQISKTTILMVGIGYVIDQRPGPTLFVLPNGDLCKSLSESRLQPIIEDCPKLAAHKHPNGKKFRLQEMYLDRMQLALVGANSPSNLASRPVVYLFLDEIDKYPPASNREASAVSLAEKRLLAQPNTKLWKTSTPTNTAGEIWRSFLNGDQRLFFVPCPHCGERQMLAFSEKNMLAQRYKLSNVGRVCWPADCKIGDEWNLARVRAEAWYECGACKAPIRDQHKAWMVERGEWVAQAPERSSRHRSYHLGSIYALWPKCSFGALAEQFLKAKSAGQTGLQDFANSVDGLPWEVRGDAADEASILAHRLDYLRGRCPVAPLAVVITADVQKQSCYWTVRAYGPYGTRYLVDYGITPGLDALAEVASRKWRGPAGEFVCTHGLIDSGDQTDAVYQFCDKNGWTPIKGWRDRTQPIQWGPGYGGKLLNVDTSYFKDRFQLNLMNDAGATGSWNLPANAGEEYAAHLAAEAKVRETTKEGRPRYVWHQLREMNHWLDCEVYQEAAALAFGLEHLEATGANGSSDNGGARYVETSKRRDGRDWWDRE